MIKSGYPNFKGLNCIGYEEITVTATSSDLSPPANTLSALVVLVANVASTAQIVANFREDANSPTATEGMPMTNLTRYGVLIGNLRTFQIISADGLDHSLRVQYYG